MCAGEEKLFAIDRFLAKNGTFSRPFSQDILGRWTIVVRGKSGLFILPVLDLSRAHPMISCGCMFYISFLYLVNVILAFTH